MKEQLKKILFPKGSQPTGSEVESLVNKWTNRKAIKRFDYLIQKGGRESHLYFILRGTMRIFYLSNETEICVGFGYENTLITSYPSFVSKQPSQYYIQALTDTEVIGISRNDFYATIHQSWNLERHWREMTEQALLGRIEREIDLFTYAPQERLQRLLKRSPHVFQLIPNKYIASYLRMTPETLSRMLRKMKS